jgi:hypothetical protein
MILMDYKHHVATEQAEQLLKKEGRWLQEGVHHHTAASNG